MSPARSLSGRSASGALWVAAALGSQQGIQLASRIVLARILLPAEFGVAGMAGVVLGALGIFLNLGFASALVYRRDRVDEASDTAFWLLPGSGLLLTAAGWAGAGAVARFFGDPAVAPVLRVISLSLFVTSFSWVPAARIARDLAFRKTFLAEGANALAFGATAIPLALAGGGAMSLAWGWLAGSIAQTAVLLAASGYRPAFRFRRDLARELFRYGGAVMSSNFAAQAVAQADAAVVGRMLGSAPLGLYAIALQAVTLVVNPVAAVAARVAFPAFAEVQSQRERLRSTTRSVLHLTAILVFPAVTGIAIAARWIMPAVFGDAWRATVPLVALLAPVGVAFALRNVIGSLMHGVGRPGSYQVVPWLQLAVLVGLAIPFARVWGAAGVAGAAAVAHGVGTVAGFELARRRLAWSVADILHPMARPAAAAAIMALAIAPLHLARFSDGAGSLVAVGIGVLSYGLAVFVLDREGVLRVQRWLRSARGRAAPIEGPGRPAP